MRALVGALDQDEYTDTVVGNTKVSERIPSLSRVPSARQLNTCMPLHPPSTNLWQYWLRLPES